MRSLALLALWAIPAGAAAPSLPLQALTETDVGANALQAAACYAHDGPSVLLVASNRNAVANWQGDLLMLDRVDDGRPPYSGAKYAGNRFKIVISPEGEASSAGGRTDQPAELRIESKGRESRATARWTCNPRT